MPLCVHCAHPAQHLYTTYKTRSNIRLGVCSRCDQFLDPLIEHPPLILLLDLILLKPRVFLHLLFNRGAPALDATAAKPKPDDARDAGRHERIWRDIGVLLSAVWAAETILRVSSPLLLATQAGMISEVLRTLSIVSAELTAQHIVTLVLALSTLHWRRWYAFGSRKQVRNHPDGRQADFHPGLITLTLLYTSLLPLLIQLFLSIWYTAPAISPHEPLPSGSSVDLTASLPGRMLRAIPAIYDVERAVNDLWHRSDRVWAGTKLLGGMSAGFGLRVLLPTRPWETTMIVLAGWLSAAVAGQGAEAILQGRR